MLIDYADPDPDFNYKLWESMEGTIYKTIRNDNSNAAAYVLLSVDTVFQQGELV